MNNRVDLTTERGLALAVDNLREISDMLVANAVTALPFPAPNATARNLRAIADALEALATATPTPPAAEAGTGGEVSPVIPWAWAPLDWIADVISLSAGRVDPEAYAVRNNAVATMRRLIDALMTWRNDGHQEKDWWALVGAINDYQRWTPANARAEFGAAPKVGAEPQEADHAR